MALPDVAALSRVPKECWRALGARLCAIDAAATHARAHAIGAGFFEPATRPLRSYHLQQENTPAAHALRLFEVHDAVPSADVEAALGAPLVAELSAGGLFAQAGGHLTSPFALHVLDGLFLFSDEVRHGDDAVMGAGPLTVALIEAARPAARVGALLDVGCGAGLLALALARDAERVVATDVNARALVFARLNAALNGIEHVEFREGDLFAPVAGERFDLVLSQPPFFPQPPGTALSTYRHGGTQGDEILQRVIAGAHGHLAPQGRAFVIANWPVVDDRSVLERVTTLVPPDAKVLVIDSEGVDPDTFCIGDIAFEHPDFGPAFAREVLALRAHLTALGIRGVRLALTLIERAAHASRASFELVNIRDEPVSAELVRALGATCDVLARGPEALLAATLRMRSGARFVSAEGASGVEILFGDGGRPATKVRLDARTKRLVELCHRAPNTAAAARRYAKEVQLPYPKVQDGFLRAVTQLLEVSLLVVEG